MLDVSYTRYLILSIYCCVAQEADEYGRGRLLQMSRMRHGQNGGSSSPHNKPRSILVIRSVVSLLLYIYETRFLSAMQLNGCWFPLQTKWS